MLIRLSAEALSDAIQDWHDADDLPRANGAEAPQYIQAGLGYVPTNQPFQTVSEVQQVLGMNYEIFRRIRACQHQRVFQKSRTPNPAFAAIEALRAIPGMTEPLAEQIIAVRQAAPPGTTGAMGGITLPGGTALMTSTAGLTYSIKSRATLPDSVSAVISTPPFAWAASVPAGRPYTVLRWRDDENS